LEWEYWQALEVLAYEDGWNNWRDFFYMRVLPDKPEDISLASHVRKMVTVFLFRLSTKKGSQMTAFFTNTADLNTRPNSLDTLNQD